MRYILLLLFTLTIDVSRAQTCNTSQYVDSTYDMTGSKYTGEGTCTDATDCQTKCSGSNDCAGYSVGAPVYQLEFYDDIQSDNMIHMLRDGRIYWLGKHDSSGYGRYTDNFNYRSGESGKDANYNVYSLTEIKQYEDLSISNQVRADAVHIRDWNWLHCGQFNCIAVRSSGEVRAWGKNSWCQAGGSEGTTQTESEPHKVSDVLVKQGNHTASCSDYACCYIRASDGAVLCHGMDGYNGNGLTTWNNNCDEYVALAGPVQEIKASSQSTCALKNKELYCWGGCIGWICGPSSYAPGKQVTATKIYGSYTDVRDFAMDNGLCIRNGDSLHCSGYISGDGVTPSAQSAGGYSRDKFTWDTSKLGTTGYFVATGKLSCNGMACWVAGKPASDTSKTVICFWGMVGQGSLGITWPDSSNTPSGTRDMDEYELNKCEGGWDPKAHNWVGVGNAASNGQRDTSNVVYNPRGYWKLHDISYIHKSDRDFIAYGHKNKHYMATDPTDDFNSKLDQDLLDAYTPPSGLEFGAETCTFCLPTANGIGRTRSCTACATGTDRPGDSLSSADTTCVAQCTSNQHVVSGVCTGCTGDKLRAAGDSTFGSDTACLDPCLIDQHVVSGVCTACAGGKHRIAGDNPTGGSDTACEDPCLVNQKVVSNVCTDCASGKYNSVRDPFSGPDTTCAGLCRDFPNDANCVADVTCSASQHVGSSYSNSTSKFNGGATCADTASCQVACGASDTCEGFSQYETLNLKFQNMMDDSEDTPNKGNAGGEFAMVMLYEGKLYWTGSNCKYGSGSMGLAKVTDMSFDCTSATYKDALDPVLQIDDWDADPLGTTYVHVDDYVQLSCAYGFPLGISSDSAYGVYNSQWSFWQIDPSDQLRYNVGAACLALRSNGDLISWGRTDVGITGRPKPSYSGTTADWDDVQAKSIPARIATGVSLEKNSITASGLASCMIQGTNKDLYCFGMAAAKGSTGGYTGTDLSDSKKQSYATYDPMGNKALDGPVDEVQCNSHYGGGFCCALKSKELYCWGWNGHGKVFTTSMSSGDNMQLTPEKIKGSFTDVTSFSVGTGGLCFIDSGKVYCNGKAVRGDTEGVYHTKTDFNELTGLTTDTSQLGVAGSFVIEGDIQCARSGKATNSFCWVAGRPGSDPDNVYICRWGGAGETNNPSVTAIGVTNWETSNGIFLKQNGHMTDSERDQLKQPKCSGQTDLDMNWVGATYEGGAGAIKNPKWFQIVDFTASLVQLEDGTLKGIGMDYSLYMKDHTNRNGNVNAAGSRNRWYDSRDQYKKDFVTMDLLDTLSPITGDPYYVTGSEADTSGGVNAKKRSQSCSDCVTGKFSSTSPDSFPPSGYGRVSSDTACDQFFPLQETYDYLTTTDTFAGAVCISHSGCQGACDNDNACEGYTQTISTNTFAYGAKQASRRRLNANDTVSFAKFDTCPTTHHVASYAGIPWNEEDGNIGGTTISTETSLATAKTNCAADSNCDGFNAASQGWSGVSDINTRYGGTSCTSGSACRAACASDVNCKGISLTPGNFDQQSGLTDGNYADMSVSSDGMKIILPVDGGKLLVSTDGGVNFNEKGSSKDWWASAISEDGTTMFAGDKDFNSGAVWRSTDSGSTWSEISTTKMSTCSATTCADNGNLMGIDCSSDCSIVYASYTNSQAGTGGLIMKSTDSGATFTDITPTVVGDDDHEELKRIACSGDGTKVLASIAVGSTGLGGGLYVSSDSGSTWTEVSGTTGFKWEDVSVSSDGMHMFASKYGATTNNQKPLLSNDGGVTWVDSTVENTLFTQIATSKDGSVVIAAVKWVSVYFSYDYGKTFNSWFYGNLEWVSVGMSSDGVRMIAVEKDVEARISTTNTHAYGPVISGSAFSVTKVDAAFTLIDGDGTSTGTGKKYVKNDVCDANYPCNNCEDCGTAAYRPGDIVADGATTCLDIITCTVGQRVQNFACVSCPAGTTRPAGDKNNEGDTACELCNENYHVSGGACVQCDSGDLRAAGDNINSGDTKCATPISGTAVSTSVTVNVAGPRETQYIDYDNDGDLDMIIFDHTASTKENALEIHENTGTTANPTYSLWFFTERNNCNSPINQVKIVDFDGDGDMDVFASAWKRGLKQGANFCIFENGVASVHSESYWQDQNRKIFSKHPYKKTEAYSPTVGRFNLVDFDFDGDLDICGSARTTGLACIENTGETNLTNILTDDDNDARVHSFIVNSPCTGCGNYLVAIEPTPLFDGGPIVAVTETYQPANAADEYYLRLWMSDSTSKTFVNKGELTPRPTNHVADYEFIDLNDDGVKDLVISTGNEVIEHIFDIEKRYGGYESKSNVIIDTSHPSVDVISAHTSLVSAQAACTADPSCVGVTINALTAADSAKPYEIVSGIAYRTNNYAMACKNADGTGKAPTSCTASGSASGSDSKRVCAGYGNSNSWDTTQHGPDPDQFLKENMHFGVITPTSIDEVHADCVKDNTYSTATAFMSGATLKVPATDWVQCIESDSADGNGFYAKACADNADCKHLTFDFEAGNEAINYVTIGDKIVFTATMIDVTTCPIDTNNPSVDLFNDVMTAPVFLVSAPTGLSSSIKNPPIVVVTGGVTSRTISTDCTDSCEQLAVVDLYNNGQPVIVTSNQAGTGSTAKVMTFPSQALVDAEVPATTVTQNTVGVTDSNTFADVQTGLTNPDSYSFWADAAKDIYLYYDKDNDKLKRCVMSTGVCDDFGDEATDFYGGFYSSSLVVGEDNTLYVAGVYDSGYYRALNCGNVENTFSSCTEIPLPSNHGEHKLTRTSDGHVYLARSHGGNKARVHRLTDGNKAACTDTTCTAELSAFTLTSGKTTGQPRGVLVYNNNYYVFYSSDNVYKSAGGSDVQDILSTASDQVSRAPNNPCLIGNEAFWVDDNKGTLSVFNLDTETVTHTSPTELDGTDVRKLSCGDWSNNEIYYIDQTGDKIGKINVNQVKAMGASDGPQSTTFDDVKGGYLNDVLYMVDSNGDTYKMGGSNNEMEKITGATYPGSKSGSQQLLTVNGKLTAVDFDGTTMKVYQFDTGSSTWAAVTLTGTMPVQKDSAIATDGQNIYVVGGDDGSGNVHAKVTMYNLVSNTAIPMTDMSAPLKDPVVEFNNNKLVIHGGVDSAVSSTTYIYDVNAQTTTSVTGGPQVHSAGSVTIGDAMYVQGGYQGTDSNLKSETWKFNYASSTWEQVTLPAGGPAATHSSILGVKSDGTLQVFGGGTDSGVVRDSFTVALKKSAPASDSIPLSSVYTAAATQTINVDPSAFTSSGTANVALMQAPTAAAVAGATLDIASCDVNYRAVASLCELCPPMFTSTGVTDPVATPNTACTPNSAIETCGRDEYVKGGKCFACVPPDTNEPGDNVTTNSQCDCVDSWGPCVSGTKKYTGTCIGGEDRTPCESCAGSWSACDTQGIKTWANTYIPDSAADCARQSGETQFCSCGKDEYAKDSMCATCPEGSTSNLNDYDPTSGDTYCLCQGAMSSDGTICAACPAGTTNSLVDHHPVNDGAVACQTQICSANQHVQAHDCVDCPFNSQRLAGDDPQGPNTKCHCKVNSKVIGGVCKACETGSNNPKLCYANQAEGDVYCTCNENYRGTADKLCVKCDEGSERAAGWYAGDGESSCSCKEGYKVNSSNICSKCPDNSVSVGGNVDGGETFCSCNMNFYTDNGECKPCPENSYLDTPTATNVNSVCKCKAGHHVVDDSGTLKCSACTNGDTNGKGDPLTTVTKCSCGPNRRNVKGECVDCKHSGTRAAGDDPNTGSTSVEICECPATHTNKNSVADATVLECTACGANERRKTNGVADPKEEGVCECVRNSYVSGAACVQCPGGSISDAGGDLSTDINTCRSLAGYYFKNQGTEHVECPEGARGGTAIVIASNYAAQDDQSTCVLESGYRVTTAGEVVLCPTGSTSAAGLEFKVGVATTASKCTLIGSAVNSTGYRVTTAGEVESCPADSTSTGGVTFEVGVARATASACICNEGFQATSQGACAQCPQYQTNDGTHKTNEAQRACYCQKGYYVDDATDSCVQCVEGSSTAEGGDPLGPSTSCDCAENYRVNANAECEICPPGTTNEPLDKSQDGETQCDVLGCEANQRVVNHACVPCPTNMENEKGDPADGINTACDYKGTTEQQYEFEPSGTQLVTSRKDGNGPAGNNPEIVLRIGDGPFYFSRQTGGSGDELLLASAMASINYFSDNAKQYGTTPCVNSTDCESKCSQEGGCEGHSTYISDYTYPVVYERNSGAYDASRALNQYACQAYAQATDGVTWAGWGHQWAGYPSPGCVRISLDRIVHIPLSDGAACSSSKQCVEGWSDISASSTGSYSLIVTNAGLPDDSVSESECSTYASSIGVTLGQDPNSNNPKGCFDQGNTAVYWNSVGGVECGAHGVSNCVQKRPPNYRITEFYPNKYMRVHTGEGDAVWKRTTGAYDATSALTEAQCKAYGDATDGVYWAGKYSWTNYPSPGCVMLPLPDRVVYMYEDTSDSTWTGGADCSEQNICVEHLTLGETACQEYASHVGDTFSTSTNSNHMPGCWDAAMDTTNTNTLYNSNFANTGNGGAGQSCSDYGGGCIQKSLGAEYSGTTCTGKEDCVQRCNYDEEDCDGFSKTTSVTFTEGTGSGANALYNQLTTAATILKFGGTSCDDDADCKEKCAKDPTCQGYSSTFGYPGTPNNKINCQPIDAGGNGHCGVSVCGESQWMTCTNAADCKTKCNNMIGCNGYGEEYFEFQDEYAYYCNGCYTPTCYFKSTYNVYRQWTYGKDLCRKPYFFHMADDWRCSDWQNLQLSLNGWQTREETWEYGSTLMERYTGGGAPITDTNDIRFVNEAECRQYAASVGDNFILKSNSNQIPGCFDVDDDPNGNKNTIYNTDMTNQNNLACVDTTWGCILKVKPEGAEKTFSKSTTTAYEYGPRTPKLALETEVEFESWPRSDVWAFEYGPRITGTATSFRKEVDDAPPPTDPYDNYASVDGHLAKQDESVIEFNPTSPGLYYYLSKDTNTMWGQLRIQLPLANIPTSGTATLSSNAILSDEVTLTGDLTITVGSSRRRLSSGGIVETTLTAADGKRHFNVPAGNKLTIVGATLQGGNPPSGAGGSILVDGGELEVTNVKFKSNSATTGGAIASRQDSASNNPKLTISSSTFEGNTGANGAGAVEALAGDLTVTQSTFKNNVATTGDGGAIHSETDATITGGVFDGNQAAGGDGGAIKMEKKSLTMEGTTLRNNGAKSGGGLLITEGIAILSNLVAESNSATEDGGAILVDKSDVNITGTTLRSNNASNTGGAIKTKGMTGKVLEINDNTFEDNRGISGGGAIHVDDDTNAVIKFFRGLFRNNKGDGNSDNDVSASGVTNVRVKVVDAVSEMKKSGVEMADCSSINCDHRTGSSGVNQADGSCKCQCDGITKYERNEECVDVTVCTGSDVTITNATRTSDQLCGPRSIADKKKNMDSAGAALSDLLSAKLKERGLSDGDAFSLAVDALGGVNKC